MKPMRILLIEDDEDDYIVARRLLKSIYGERLELTWAKTYEEGIEKILPCDFDVCLLDYQLGARNGVELLREICADKFPVPTILMTGQGDHEIDMEASAAGAADYLIKNQPDTVLLERAIRYSIQHKQSESSKLELLKEREAREVAERANQAKDAFLAMATHELRSPLNAILGWTQLLRAQTPDADTVKNALEIIEKSARTQSRLIEDILDTARSATGKLRIDVRSAVLPEVIAAAIDIVKPAADAKNIKIVSTLDENVNVISGDPERLQQVMWNLLSNAIKFTPQDGEVSIHLERADPHARVTIRDNGKGIEPNFLRRIFEPFAQQPDEAKATRRRSGLGLGLALARQLVELHGGTIEAASDGPSKGSTFTLQFPLRAVHLKESEAQSETAARRFKHPQFSVSLVGLRILVVDDQDDARALVSTVLKQAGAEVTAAASADEALAQLVEGAKFDALVSDIGMPDKDGYTLLREIRQLTSERGKNMPAVALTAFGRTTDRIRALAAGFKAHIPKPVEPEELVIVVASLTGRSHS